MKKIILLLSLIINSILTAQTFTGSGGIITDNQQILEFPITVSGLSQSTLSTNYGLKQVCLNIAHTWDSDLSVWLVAPDGTQTSIFSGIGGDGDNFSNTCFNQSATNSINAGNPPYNGVYRPQETIGNVNNGQNGNGIWKLRIQDSYPQDEGRLFSWLITFGNNAPAPFVFTSSNLPIVIINTSQNIVDNPAIIGTMKIIDNGIGAINNVSDTSFDYNGNINIELRGNYSQSLPQKPYKIELLNDIYEETDASLLGMPEESDWALLANYNDKVFMRNQLAYTLFNQMGHYAGRTKHCEVIVNGSYQGVYILSETIKRNSNRVAISRLNPDENNGIDVTGGYIIKNDYWDTNTGWQLNNSPIDHPEMTVGLAYHYPKANTISNEQKAYIASFIDEFENSLYSADFTNPNTGYKKYIDELSFIDYFIVNELSRNNDGFKKSSYFHKDKDTDVGISKLFAGPVWDFDWAWKNINECSFLSVTDGSGWAYWVNDCGPDVNSPGWYVRLLQDTNFQNNLRCRWESLRETTLNLTNLFNYIDTTASYINDAQARHFEKWGNLGIPTGAPEVDGDPNTFEGQITKFKNWISTRIAWLDANIPGNSNGCSLDNTNFENKNYIIYPNPAKEHITIATKNNDNYKIKIIDSLGKIIFDNEFFGTENTINTSSLKNGFYFCIINNGKETAVEKLIITK